MKRTWKIEMVLRDVTMTEAGTVEAGLYELIDKVPALAFLENGFRPYVEKPRKPAKTRKPTAES